MKEPSWAKLNIETIDYNGISYFAAPKDMPKSLDEIDPEIIDTYNKLGIPLEEQKLLEGIAVDVVFDSVSLVTTLKDKLAKLLRSLSGLLVEIDRLEISETKYVVVVSCLA